MARGTIAARVAGIAGTAVVAAVTGTTVKIGPMAGTPVVTTVGPSARVAVVAATVGPLAMAAVVVAAIAVRITAATKIIVLVQWVINADLPKAAAWGCMPTPIRLGGWNCRLTHHRVNQVVMIHPTRKIVHGLCTENRLRTLISEGLWPWIAQ